MPLSYAVSITNRFHSFITTSGTSLAVIRATDENNDPMVFWLDSSVKDLLQIDNTGNLTLQKELDREVSWKMREISELPVHQFVDHNLETAQFSTHSSFSSDKETIVYTSSACKAGVFCLHKVSVLPRHWVNSPPCLLWPRLGLSLYLFYQAELFPNYKTRRPALLNILFRPRDMSRDHFIKIWLIGE